MGNPAAAIYGVITVGALLAAEGGGHDTYAETLIALLLAISMYWIAHAYSAYAGGRFAEGERVTGEGLALNALGEEFPILAGAGPAVAGRGRVRHRRRGARDRDHRRRLGLGGHDRRTRGLLSALRAELRGRDPRDSVRDRDRARNPSSW